MTAKEYLQQIHDLEKALYNKRIELYRLECFATSITAPTDHEAVQTSNISDKVGNGAVDIATLKNEIIAQEKQFLEQWRECIGVIEKVRQISEMQYNILHKKYIASLTLKEISKEENYSYDYIREMHGEALKTVEKFMPKSKEPTQTHIL